jgi:hypothetical protein
MTRAARLERHPGGPPGRNVFLAGFPLKMLMEAPGRSRAFLVAIFALQVVLSVASTGAAGATTSPGSVNKPSYPQSWWDEYHSPAEFYELIKTIAADHSNIVKLINIGTTYEGRPLLVAKVSDNPNTDEADEPDVLIIAGTHAREWTTQHAAAYLLNYITGHYRESASGALPYALPGEADNDSYASWLVDNRQIYILLMVNPDGIDYSMTTDALWRKNMEPNDGPVGRGCPGTDINRNFAWHWGELQGDSHNPCSEIYAGPSEPRTSGYYSLIGWRPGDPNPGGFSTAEARALRDLETAHDFKIALSLHSFGGVFLFPWGYTEDPAPDEADFVAMAGVVENLSGYGMEAPGAGYKVAGEWGDWTYGALGTYAFTMEIGGEFQPPATDIINQSKLILTSELFMAETADDLHLKEPVVNLTNDPLAEVTPNSQIAVTATVEAPNGLDEDGKVTLVYSRNGGAAWTEVAMAAGENSSTFTGTLSGLRAGASAIYYVKVTDNQGITRTGPFSAPYTVFEVRARNGILEQVGDVGLVAILLGAAAAGVLYYLRVLRPALVRRGAYAKGAGADYEGTSTRRSKRVARVRTPRGR